MATSGACKTDYCVKCQTKVTYKQYDPDEGFYCQRCNESYDIVCPASFYNSPPDSECSEHSPPTVSSPPPFRTDIEPRPAHPARNINLG